MQEKDKGYMYPKCGSGILAHSLSWFTGSAIYKKKLVLSKKKKKLQNVIKMEEPHAGHKPLEKHRAKGHGTFALLSGLDPLV